MGYVAVILVAAAAVYFGYRAITQPSEEEPELSPGVEQAWLILGHNGVLYLWGWVEEAQELYVSHVDRFQPLEDGTLGGYFLQISPGRDVIVWVHTDQHAEDVYSWWESRTLLVTPFVDESSRLVGEGARILSVLAAAVHARASENVQVSDFPLWMRNMELPEWYRPQDVDPAAWRLD